MNRKTYDETYKRSAVKLAEFSGKQLKEIAQDMGIHVTSAALVQRIHRQNPALGS